LIQFKVTFQTVIIWFSAITVCLVLFTVKTPAAGSAGISSDIAPPKITIVSPLKDSRTETGVSRIEILFFDILSGIDSDTIHLFVDRIEVTAKAVVEQEDVTGQAVGSPWRITYTPEPALSKGQHQIRFSVQDLTGNPAELGWSFEVAAGGGGMRIGGSNTLRVDRSPVEMITDTWDLNAQGQCRETDIRLNVTGKITDYPGADPDYYYQGYNFYYDDYALGFYHRQTSAVFGYVNASLDSELLQIGLQMYGNGGIVSNTADGAGGQFNWTVFSGDSGSSYGTSSTVYRMTGAGGEWRRSSGATLGGYYVSLGDSKGYNFTGFKGNTLLGGLGLFRLEMIHGSSETYDTSGNGWALHWDKSLRDDSLRGSSLREWDLGLDYTESEPEYPNIGSSALFTSDRKGLRTYAVRTSVTVNEVHNFSFDGLISRDNLDQSQSYTVTRRNIAAGYDYRPDSDWSLNIDYQGDFQHKEGDSLNQGQQDHVMILGMGRNIGTSKLKATCTLDAARYPKTSDTYDGVQLLGSWTCPVDAYNLTPSLQWNNKKIENGDRFKAIEIRLTLDRKFYPDLARSSIGLFYRVSDELNGGIQTKEINCGVLPYLYFKIGPDSTLTLVYEYRDWHKEITDEAGIDKTINLTWKLTF
jgi:hypothetical protein